MSQAALVQLGISDGLQDSALPECQKTVFNVIRFQTPAATGVGVAGRRIEGFLRSPVRAAGAGVDNRAVFRERRFDDAR